MKQVFIKKGKAIVEMVPEPMINDNEVLVQVYYSCISIGTELFKVKASGRPLLRKILDRPQDIKKVLESIRNRGLKDTIVKVRGKVEGKNPIGYSASGIVLEVGRNIGTIKPGEKVAVAGDGIANHAEFVAVPENLTVKIPGGASLKHASSVALGSIALQGIRRSEPEIGNFIVVMGLGNIGQIIAQALNASGCQVIGIDIEKSRIDMARSSGIDYGLDARSGNMISDVLRITGGYGADSVIIAASAKDDAVINDAMKMCRKKGKIVIVGSVGLNIERGEFYEKELDVLISTSYGPGRYDVAYEEKSLDYPYHYVRWTENRNMKEYLRLLAENKINIGPLIEKIFKAGEAGKAYEYIKSGDGSPLIVLLEYDKEPVREKTISTGKLELKDERINTGIIGAGGFVRDIHLPNLMRLDKIFNINAICCKNGSSASNTAENYNAYYATTDYKKILSDKKIDLVFIATRHDLHAKIATEAALAGKAVFLEKPMALNANELEKLAGTIKKAGAPFMVGFNRRFSPLSRRIRELIRDRTNPVIINYRVNAGPLPSQSWVHSAEGGGRNIGEACHFYDLFNYFTDSEVISVKASGISVSTDQFRTNENFSVIIKYSDGSVCNLIYTAFGSDEVPKEQMEIYFDQKIICLNDYKDLKIYGSNQKGITSSIPDKGHYEELRSFGDDLKNNKSPIPLWQLIQATEISFEVERQLSER